MPKPIQPEENPVNNRVTHTVKEANISEDAIRPAKDKTGMTDRNTRMGEVIDKANRKQAVGKPPTAGDRDANAYQAKVVGEEAVGGTTPTPAQNNVDDLGADLGVEMNDSEAIQISEKLKRRDDQRWLLDPDSAEDR
jgi:hypothetical protein